MKHGVLAFLLFLFGTAITKTGWPGEKTYTLARAPQLSTRALEKSWQPLVEYLQQRTGARFKLKLYEERDDFEGQLANAEVDFFYGNPGYVIVAHHRHGYLPLLRSDRKKLQGIIIVRSDSQYTDISQLNDHIIAFPSRNAFAASLFVRAQLRETEKLTFQAAYLGTHDNVYRSVLLGRYSAGAGVVRTLEREPENLRRQLRILYKTPGISPHALSAHPRVPASLRERITEAMFRLEESDEGKALLEQLNIQRPVAADYRRDYLPFKEVALDMYSYLVE